MSFLGRSGCLEGDDRNREKAIEYSRSDETKFANVDSQLYIPVKVDNALTTLLDAICNLVLQNVGPINGENIEFELELKHLLRELLMRIVKRIKEDDSMLESFARDIFSCTLMHFHNTYPWTNSSNNLGTTSKLRFNSGDSGVFDTVTNQSTILCNLYESDKLHPAMCSRSSEIAYLKKAFSKICQFDFPEDLKCSKLAINLITEAFVLYCIQLSDLIADPDSMNLVIAKILSGTRTVLSSQSPQSVPFLYRYYNPNASKTLPSLDITVSLTSEPQKGVDAQQIMKDGLLCSIFMKFLHKEDAVQYIQCLGDLREIKQARHFASRSSFMKLSEKYFDRNSVESINLSPGVVSEMQTLLRAFGIVGWDRKEKFVLQIEREIFVVLNECYINRFKQTHDFLIRYYIDDMQSRAMREASFSESDEREGSSEVNRGSLELDYYYITSIPEEEKSIEESYTTSSTKIDIDLNSLRVELENDLTEIDSDMHYCIHVRKVAFNLDNEGFHWTVYRRYEHFVVLHDKLKYHYSKELNKDSRLAKLPSKPTLVITSKAALEQGRKMVPNLELYLRSLLCVPKLKHSAILYDFLTKESREEFEAPKLLEKLALKKNGFTDNLKTSIAKNDSGKPLETGFLPRYVTSMQGKPRPKSQTPIGVRKLSNSAGNEIKSPLHNNALLDIYAARVKRPPVNSSDANEAHFNKTSGIQENSGKEVDLKTYFDYLVYFSIYIYSLSEIYLKLLSGPVKTLFSSFINRVCSKFVREKIQVGLHEEFVEQFLVFLTSNFKPKISTQTRKIVRSSQDKLRRKNRTLKHIRKALNPVFVNLVVGKARHEETTDILFRTLQYSKLNKHLFYQILDKIIDRLYINENS